MKKNFSFYRTGIIVGARVSEYLLEKSRIVRFEIFNIRNI
jgi:myosin heavy subunit